MHLILLPSFSDAKSCAPGESSLCSTVKKSFHEDTSISGHQCVVKAITSVQPKNVVVASLLASLALLEEIHEKCL